MKTTIKLVTTALLIWVSIKIADIYDWPPLPVTEYDQEIIKKTKTHFHYSTKWNKSDDRDCSGKEETVSLYCALYYSSREVSRNFHHESAVMESVREAILELHGDKDYSHILMDFNNDQRSTLDDIQNVLSHAQDILARKWHERNDFPNNFYQFYHSHF